MVKYLREGEMRRTGKPPGVRLMPAIFLQETKPFAEKTAAIARSGIIFVGRISRAAVRSTAV